MESKTILFTVDGDNISPRTEQKAGVQGNHNVTQVVFDVSALNYDFADTDIRTRIQFVDGAGGFYSTGFLDVVIEDDKKFVSTPIPDNVTNAGGAAYAYLVITEIAYEGKKALEKQVYISPPGKLFYTHSGVGSPSEYAYRVGVSNALVNAERASEDSESFRNESEQFASDANAAKESAEKLKIEVETKLANGDYKGEPGPQGEKGDKGDKGDKGVSGVYLGSGEMPEDFNVQIDPDGEPIEVYTKKESDNLYATKDEIVGTLGTINEVLATLVEVE